MLHVDIPQRSEIEQLYAHRGPACLSLYLPTTPLTQDAQSDRIAMKNLVRDGLGQFRDAEIHKRDIAAMGELLDDLIDDDDFWKFQARGLAVFATPERTLTYRLPTTLSPIVEVADRFYVTPLLRSVTFPHSAYVLVLSQNEPRVVEVSGDLPAARVKVDGMPKDAAAAAGKSSIGDRSPSGRMQGSEGQKVRLRQYARLVDQALRSVLHGQNTPLVLATAPPLDSIYRSVNTYPNLAGQGLTGNFETVSDADIAAQAREVLDGLYRAELASFHDLYRQREEAGRATADLSQAARAATMGAVDTLLVDIDEIVNGTVDSDGRVTLSEGPSAASYGVVDEIAGRVLATGGRVLGVRKADLPSGTHLAAVLRWAV